MLNVGHAPLTLSLNVTMNSVVTTSSMDSAQPADSPRHDFEEEDSTLKVSSNYFSAKQKRQQALKTRLENLDLSFSIAVVGTSQVGKFTMVNAECADGHDEVSHGRARTRGPGIQIRTKVYHVSDKKCKADFYATTGNEAYEKHTARYVAGFPITLYVFDVNDEVSLQAIEGWFEDTTPRTETIGGLTPIRFLIGNKIDTPGLRKVHSSDAREFAEKFDMKYFETCALDKGKLNTMFTMIISNIIDAASAACKPLNTRKEKRRGSFMALNDFFQGNGAPKEAKGGGEELFMAPSLLGFNGGRGSGLFSQGSEDFGSEASTASPMKSKIGSFFGLSVTRSHVSLDFKQRNSSSNGRRGSVFGEASRTTEFVEQKYPYPLQMGLQLSRKSRLAQRRELNVDLPQTTEGTKALDWL